MRLYYQAVHAFKKNGGPAQARTGQRAASSEPILSRSGMQISLMRWRRDSGVTVVAHSTQRAAAGMGSVFLHSRLSLRVQTDTPGIATLDKLIV